MTKKNITPTVVLAVICLCAALLLALTNMVTKKKIESDLIEKANAAMREVLPNAEGFLDITDKYTFPKNVQAAHKADNGYVFQITYKGYNSGNIMMCGVDNDGKLVNSKIITYTDTYNYQDKLDMTHGGADFDTAKENVELITTPTSDTGRGYSSALRAALDAYDVIVKGSSVTPDEEEQPEPEVFDNGGFMTKTDEEVFALAKEAFGLTSLEVLTIDEEIQSKLPTALKRIYKTNAGYLLYTATTTEYIKPYDMNETEALVATDKFGTVTDVELLTWKVWGDTSELDPDFVEQINNTDALVESIKGMRANLDPSVDLIASATNSSNNLVNSIYDSLSAFNEYILPTPVYTYIAIAVMAVALIISVSLAVVFKRRRRV